jgi:hypothetical protein
MPEWNPTPEEIERECERIRSNWTETERLIRLGKRVKAYHGLEAERIKYVKPRPRSRYHKE